MSFTNIWALLLLVLLPVLLIIAWPRRSPLHRVRESISIVIRGLIVLLVVLALAGIAQIKTSNNLTTIFLLDVSDSVGLQEGGAALTYIRQALASMGADDRAGVVMFGADALVEKSVSASNRLNDLASIPIRSHTDIAGAVQLGMSLFPDNTAGRLVILSDGEANLGNARQAVRLAQANGVEVSTIMLTGKTGDDEEVRLDSLSAPSTLHEGERFDLVVKIHSTTAMVSPIQIISEGRLVAQQDLTLHKGDNRFILPLTAGKPGFPIFQVQLSPPVDTFPQNNRLDAFSRVEGPLSILLVAGHTDDEGKPLAGALRATGLTVTEISPAEMPSDIGQLSAYKAVILVNVPSFKLAPRQLNLLQSYVRDLGNGLVVVGGEESYGPGGYFQTPLEETLPVNMTITDTTRLPGMSMIMVIDKSGSMESSGSQAGGLRKVELAKEAIYRSIDLLVPWDRIGVVAFDNAARWVLKPTLVVDINGIKDAVGTIRASGGTDILAGLQAAATAITKEPTQVRHIILLTDGGANPGGIPKLTSELAEQGVTVSVVAIGQGYAPFLEDVAIIGNGRFYFADDASVIPQIFAQETSLASRSYIIDEDFTPKAVYPSPILQGLNSLPELHGYVAVSSKLTAQTILSGGEKGDPILVQWQYGLGRAVAWTSDAKGQWATDWLAWSEFPRFWGQVVRWTVVAKSGGVLESQVRLEGDKAVVVAEILGADGGYRNNLNVSVNMVAPNLETQTVSLRQTAPGLYEGDFRPDETGVYLMLITGYDGEELAAKQTRGFAVNYSPEYRSTGDGAALLTDLATIGGGQPLPLDIPSKAFAHTLPPARGVTELWPLFLLAAILLLPLDVGIRRIIFGREDLQLLWAKIERYLPKRQTAQPQFSSAGHLLKVKSKQKDEIPINIKMEIKSVVEQTPTVIKPVEPEPDISPNTGTEQVETESTVRRLMKVKRKRREGDKK